MLFISATNTGMGKTYATLQLLRLLRERGRAALCCKPLETGVCDIAKTDFAAQYACLQSLGIVQHYQAQKGGAILPSAASLCLERFALPASPFVSALAENRRIAPDSLLRFVQGFAALAGIEPLLIEGAGGLFVPICHDYFIIDYIKELGARVLLVSSGILGELNTICLSLEALRARSIAAFVWINPKNASEHADFVRLSEPFLRAAQIPYYIAHEGLQHIARALCEERQ